MVIGRWKIYTLCLTLIRQQRVHAGGRHMNTVTMRISIRAHNLLDTKQSDHKTQNLWKPGLISSSVSGVTNCCSKT